MVPMLKKVITFKKGRKCKYQGCKQPLSVYNDGIYCHMHANKSFDEQKVKVLRRLL